MREAMELNANNLFQPAEFPEWLESRLETLGIDSRVYGRCIQSILRQPPDQLSPDEKNWTLTVRTALIDLLRTVEYDQDKSVKHFVGEIIDRFKRSNSFEDGDKLYEGIDSGVCPSPAESLQNYDLAFPPLGSIETSFLFPNDLLDLQSGTSPPRSITPAFSQPRDSISSGSSAKRLKIDQDTFSRKKPGSVPVLHSAPKDGGKVSYSFEPHFVVPQIHSPSSHSLEQFARGANDVPFWPQQCSTEWICPKHKPQEFLFFSQKFPLKEEQAVEIGEFEMFDAPRFALHIINEAPSEEKDPEKDSYALWSSSDDVIDSVTRKAEFAFSLNRRASANLDGVEFCLPKVHDIAKLDRSDLSSGAKSDSAFFPSNCGSIPIAASTHFVPIRSESMEDAYYPKPGFDSNPIVSSSDQYHTAAPGILRFKAVKPDIAVQTDESDGEGVKRMDEADEDQLLRYVSSISLMAPLCEDKLISFE